MTHFNLSPAYFFNLGFSTWERICKNWGFYLQSIYHVRNVLPCGPDKKTSTYHSWPPDQHLEQISYPSFSDIQWNVSGTLAGVSRTDTAILKCIQYTLKHCIICVLDSTTQSPVHVYFMWFLFWSSSRSSPLWQRCNLNCSSLQPNRSLPAPRICSYWLVINP